MRKNFVSAILLFVSTAALAEPKTLSIATIIPDGTPAAKVLKDFAKSVESETNGEVSLKFKWGGSAGGDQDVLGKIKAGQLQGAMFAGQIMDQVAPSVRSAEIPFQFGKDRKKARAFMDNQKKSWESKISAAGFHALAFYEVGFVYLCGSKPLQSISDIKSSKVWLWPGDKLGKTVIDQLEAKAVELDVKDTFKALSDGRLEFAYAPAIAIVALQWYSKANHIVADPISFASGTLLLSDSSWRGLSPKDQAALSALAKPLSERLKDAAEADEKESLEALASMGVKISALKQGEGEKLKAISKSIAQKWHP
jgi:TRAP-type C4-dicarboxylate transport system substrate-binding protein